MAEQIYSEVSGSTSKVVTSLSALEAKLESLNARFTSAAGSASVFTNAVTGIGDASKNANLGTLSRSISGIASASKRLETASGSLAPTLVRVSEAVNAMPAMNQSTIESLTSLSGALKPLGTSMKNVTKNSEGFAAALQTIILGLNQMPALTAQATETLNMLAKVAPIATAGSKGVKALGQSCQVMGKQAKAGSTGLFAMLSMAKRYVVTGIVIKLITGLSQAVSNAMSNSAAWIEDMNYFNVAYGQMAEKAGAYYTNISNALGIDMSSLVKNGAMFEAMSKSLGASSDAAYLLSTNLVAIGIDLASLTGKNLQDTWDALQSGVIAGQYKPLAKNYGINVTEAAIAQTALNYGLEQSVETMNPLDKAFLRYLTVLDAAKLAQGDMAKTLESPANMTRIFQSAVMSLSRAVGNFMMPILIRVIPYVIAFTKVLANAFNVLAGLMGFEPVSFANTGEYADFTGGIEDIGDVADDSSGSIKELKKNIMGFDQFNILSENKASGGGGGGVGGGAYNSDLEKLLKGYDLMLGQLTTTKAEEAFKKISEALQPLGESFKKLFEAVQDNYPAFKDFYDKVLVPIGNWVIGTGLPALVDYLGNIAQFFADHPKLAITLAAVLAALKGISLLGNISTVFSISSSLAGGTAAAAGTAGAIGAGGTIGMLASWATYGLVICATIFLSYEAGKTLAEQSSENFATSGVSEAARVKGIDDPYVEALDAAGRKDNQWFVDKKLAALSKGDLAQFAGLVAIYSEYWGDTTVIWQDGLTNIEASNSKWITMEKQAAIQIDRLNKDKLKSYRDAHNGISETMNGMPSYVKKAWDATTDTVTIATRDQSRTIQDYEAQLKSSVQITADTVKLTTAQSGSDLTYQSKIATQEAAGYYGGMPSTVQGYLDSLTGSVSTATSNAGSALTGGTASSTTATSEYYRNMINKVADYLTGLMSYSQRAVTNSFETFQGMPTSVQKYLGLTWSEYKASQVITLPHFATGGFPEDGIFAANHNELVGKFDNGRTAVANNIQIIDGIRYGVAEGVLSALRSTGGNSSGVTYEMLYRAVRDANKETKPSFAPIILNGREVGEAVISWVNSRTDASGISPVKA